MKILHYFLLCILIVVISCQTTSNNKYTLKEFHHSTSKTILVAAHRGAHLDNFENSIASTKKAISLGVDIIELDIRTTKDGVIILMHDSSIDRTTTGKGEVKDLTFAELKSFRLKSPDGKISKETIPSFEEILLLSKGKIMIDIDMKTDNVKGIVEIVQKTGTTKEVFYFDNDYDQLDRIKKLDPSAQIMPRAYSFEMADSAITKYAPPVVHIDSKFYTKELAKMIQQHHARIWINSLGEIDSFLRKGVGEKALEKLLVHGANIIQTDEPEKLLVFLKGRGLHR